MRSVLGAFIKIVARKARLTLFRERVCARCGNHIPRQGVATIPGFRGAKWWCCGGDHSQRRTLAFISCPGSQGPCVLDEGGEQLLRKRLKLGPSDPLGDVDTACLEAAGIYNRGKLKQTDRILRRIDHDQFVVINADAERVHRPAAVDGLASLCCNRRVGTTQQRSVAWAVAMDDAMSFWEACGNCFGVSGHAFADVVDIAVGSDPESVRQLAGDTNPPPAPHPELRVRKPKRQRPV